MNSLFKSDIIKHANALALHNAYEAADKNILLITEGKGSDLIRAAGLNKLSDHVIELQTIEKERSKTLNALKPLSVLRDSEIKELCIRYHFRFLRSGYYLGPIDERTGKKMVEFLEKNGDPSLIASASNRFYIMAPPESFRAYHDTLFPSLLIYQHDNGLYSIVDKFGGDPTIFRSVFGWVTANAKRFFWSMLIAPIALGAILSLFMHVLELPYDHVPILLFAILAIIRLAFRQSYESETDKYFSEKAWDRPDHSYIHPFRM